jgi:hypothetical protein
MTVQSPLHHRPCLHVYVVWRPTPAGPTCEPPEGNVLAERIHSHLCRDADEPLNRGLGIPVCFRRRPAEPGGRQPLPIDLDEAQHTFVIVLVDNGMVLESKVWEPYVQRIVQQAEVSEGRHRVLPISLSRAAFQFAGIPASANYLRYHELQAEARGAAVSSDGGGLRITQERTGLSAGGGESYLIRVNQQPADAAVRWAREALLTGITHELCRFLTPTEAERAALVQSQSGWLEM